MVTTATRRKIIAAVAGLCLFNIYLFFWPSFAGTISMPSSPTVPAAAPVLKQNSPAMAPITHIVLFQLKDEASAEAMEPLTAAMVALKDQCLHPKTGKPYIVSISGGSNNSPEDRSNGMNVGFVVEFDSAEDRDYYIDTDPAHKDFKSFAFPKVAGVTVFDFTAGVFKPA